MVTSGCSSMFNSYLSMPQMFKIALLTFFILMIIRHLFIKTKLLLFMCHTIIYIFLYIMAIGGGGVQNDGYRRLEKFIELEKRHELDYAKQNPKNYDSMFAIDLDEFKNSEEFRAYLKRHDVSVDKAEARFIGWIFFFLSEIAMMFVYTFRYIAVTTRKRFFSRHL